MQVNVKSRNQKQSKGRMFNENKLKAVHTELTTPEFLFLMFIVISCSDFCKFLLILSLMVATCFKLGKCLKCLKQLTEPFHG